jgi:exosome complex component MTR3
MDRKRVTGPELSVAPIYKNNKESTPKVLDQKKRLDKRGLEDIRPICKFISFIRF